MVALVEEHPTEPCYHEAYRKYHLTDDRQDHYNARHAYAQAMAQASHEHLRTREEAAS